MNGIAVVALALVVAALVMGVVVAWDRLVGTALVGVVGGASWIVARSEGRWWFWPVLVGAVLAVIGALIVAVLVS
jgi:hypothetical protein